MKLWNSVKELLNVQLKSSTVTINGVSYRGNNLTITENDQSTEIKIDGKVVDCTNTTNSVINLAISGNTGTITTTSGNVTCGDVSGTIETVSGDIRCYGVDGDISTVSGDVFAEHIAGDVSTVSGDIKIK